MPSVFKQIFFSLFIIVIVGLVYFKSDLSAVTGEKSVQKNLQQPTPFVIVERAKIGAAVEGFEAVGTVRAMELIDVRAKISGYVQKIWATAGQDVEKNAPIISLIADERKADNDNFAAQLQQAEAKLKDVQKNYERSKALIVNEFTSQAAFDTASANLSAAQSEVNSLKAQLQSAKSRLEDSIVRAPFSGVVGISDAQIGSFVDAGVRITTLANIDTVKVELSLPERAVLILKKGMVANISPISQKSVVLKGEILEIDTEINPSTRQVRVNLLVPNSTRQLTNGLSVIAKIEATVRQSALLIPEAAIIGDGLRHFIFTVDETNVVQRKIVALGVRSSGTVEIVEGLSADERIVIEGHQKIRHGQKVKVQ